jgi:hypothetical protein
MRRSSVARPSSLLEKSSSKSKLKSQIELGKIPQERMMSSPPQIQVANLDHLGLYHFAKWLPQIELGEYTAMRLFCFPVLCCLLP